MPDKAKNIYLIFSDEILYLVCPCLAPDAAKPNVSVSESDTQAPMLAAMSNKTKVNAVEEEVQETVKHML